MAFLYIQPRYRAFLHQHGLVTAEDFLRLSGVIYGGHPDRHIARVTIGDGDRTLVGFLKKEHRVPWRDRLANFWAGFGFVSKSVREMKVLNAAGPYGPDVVAAGEVGRRAFLLLGEIAAAVELRFCLRAAHRERRRELAMSLGKVLARLHDAGLAHGDLFAKHILVKEAPKGEFTFVDWQRGRIQSRVSWRQRARDLAAIDASLADELATPVERLRLFQAYWHEAWATRQSQRHVLRLVREYSRKLQRKRKIREMRQAPLAAGKQNLIWLDGEALCVTRAFWEQTGQRFPAWLRLDDFAPKCSRPLHISGFGVVPLTYRRVSRPWTWLACRLRRRYFNSPEFEYARALFQLERFGIAVPKLLAVGQRFPLPWQSESFVLTVPVAGTVPFKQWLQRTWDDRTRDQVLYEAGALLRRLHEAGYAVGAHAERAFLLREEERTFVVNPQEGLQRLGRVCQRRVFADLRSLAQSFSLGRTQTLRFLYGYCGRKPVRNARAQGNDAPDTGTAGFVDRRTERQVCA
jgi:tRNA A-37 threonylcarbamoyl transferase component Bud32